MSLIIDPNKTTIKIEFDQATGGCGFEFSKDIPFPLLVSIFAQILLTTAQQLGNQIAGSGPNPSKTFPGAPPGVNPGKF